MTCFYDGQFFTDDYELSKCKHYNIISKLTKMHYKFYVDEVKGVLYP